MFKKLGLASVCILIIAATAFLLLSNKDKGTQYQGNSKVDHPTAKDEDYRESNSNALINEILQLAKKGKVLHAPYVAGETKIEVVHNKWGEPEQTTSLANATYEQYAKQNVSVGYHNQLIFDVRSFHPELSKIHFNDIKKVIGEPDDVRYYKDKTYNQIILVYQVNSSYLLKWILSKPSESEPNPVVHHVSVYTEVDKHVENKMTVSELLEEMSLDEKIGQMIFAGIDEDTTLTQHIKNLINDNHVGGIIFYPENLKTPSQTVKLLNGIKAENEQNKLPLLLGVDQEGGRITRLPGDLKSLPTNLEIGKRNNTAFSYEIGEILGKELNAFGFNLDFAPVLDVNSNPDNPIIGDRSFGNNPELVSKLGIQTMKGIQSQNIISVIKHFPGHGDTSVDSHLELPIVNKSREELEKLELKPFRKAVENGADVVMVAHILLPRLDKDFPSSMSGTIINGILRNQLEFNGVVITDDMTMDAIANYYDIGQAAVQSVKAGSDIILVAHDYPKIIAAIHALKAAVNAGEITEERINASVSRIIQLKRKYDIDNEKVSKVNLEKVNESIEKVLDKYR